ncbi:hypothetical protein RFI_36977, partial [Reticulomyxa filosa]
NIEQLAKSNNKLYQINNIPFSMVITSNKYMKKKLIIGQYSISLFHSKNIIFDGCVYVVNCIMNGFGNYHIIQQLISTNLSIICCHFRFHVFTCSWPIDIKNIMELGRNLLEISKINEAIELFRFVICFLLQTLHNSHINIADSYSWLGRAYSNKGEYNKAIEYYEKSLKIKSDKFGYNHPDIAIIYNKKGEQNKAIEYYENSFKININIFGPDHLNLATLYNNLGNIYNGKGEYDKAIEYCEKDIKIILNELGSNHPDIAISYNNLGCIYSNKGEYDK